MEYSLEELNTNKEKRREYIMDDLHKKMEWLKKNTDHNVFGIFLRGSQNYEQDIYTEEYMSDIDVIAITIPSLEDVIRHKEIVSYTEIMDDNTHIDVKDIRTMKDNWFKANPSYLEILFTEFYLVGDSFEIYIEELMNKADDIAMMHFDKFLSSTKGMIGQKRKALYHPYPTIIEKINKWGWDGKQLSHELRLLWILKEVCNGVPYRNCLVPSEEKYSKQLLLDLKTNKIPANVEDAVKMADQIVEESKNIVDDFREKNGVKELDEEILSWLDEFIYNVIYDQIESEILKKHVNK